MRVPAELGEFREITEDSMVRDLLPEEHQYSGSYYGVAYRETDGGYLMKVLQVDDHRFVHNIIDMYALRDQGFGGLGLRATHEFLDQSIRTWMASRGQPSHETVDMVTADGDTVSIDLAIAAIIQSLWDQGVRTAFSCQGGNATPTGPNEGNIVYDADDHNVLVDILGAAELTNLRYVPGPSSQPNLRTAYFDPVE